MLLTLFSILFLGIFSIPENDFMNEYERILNTTVKKYSYRKEIIPKTSFNKPLNVTIELMLKTINDISVSTQEMKTTYTVCYDWVDHRLTWENSTIPTVVIPSDDIWTPEINIYNVIEVKENEKKWVQFHKNGFAYMCADHYTSLFCRIDVRKFPFDVQECYLMFFSKHYETPDLKLIIYEDSERRQFYKDYFKDSNGWEFLSLNHVEFEKPIGITPYPSSFAVYCFDISRNPTDAFLTILCPTILTSLLSLLTLLLPIECCAKLELGFTIFLTLCVNALVIKEGVPSKTSEVPIVIKMNAAITTMVAVSISITILATRGLKNPNKLPPIPKILHWILYYIGKPLFVHFTKESNENYADSLNQVTEMKPGANCSKQLTMFESEILSKVQEISMQLHNEEVRSHNYKEWLKLAELLDKFFAGCFIITYSYGWYILLESLKVNKFERNICKMMKH